MCTHTHTHINMLRKLSVVTDVVYIIVFLFSIFMIGSCSQGERSGWPGHEMMGHVSRGVDPSPYHLVLYEILCALAFIVEIYNVMVL